MDDLYAINSAKTEFREAFNSGDPERLIALFDPAFVYMPDGVPAANGTAAADAIRAQFRELTARYNVQLLPIIIEIRIQDSVAWDYGWHTWRKTPRDGGSQVIVKDRYVNCSDRLHGGGQSKIVARAAAGAPTDDHTASLTSVKRSISRWRA
jgi:ketosteroid isomerase-like protein